MKNEIPPRAGFRCFHRFSFNVLFLVPRVIENFISIQHNSPDNIIHVKVFIQFIAASPNSL